MVAGAWVIALLAKPLLNVVYVLIDDRLTEKLSVANVSHVCVLFGAERVEAADRLSAAIIFHEADLARHVDLALLLCRFFLFDRHWGGTVATAVANYVFHGSKESRVTMKVDFAAFCVPFRVKHFPQILVLLQSS